jgi:hypothetical protein
LVCFGNFSNLASNGARSYADVNPWAEYKGRKHQECWGDSARSHQGIALVAFGFIFYAVKENKIIKLRL